ncbi:MAG: DUF948 domain-containing protein [Saccharofermentanales bacterium]|jgi:predicted PurR-regulated permease PerM
MTAMLLEASIPLSVLFYVVIGTAGTVALVALSIFLFRGASALGRISKLVKEITPDVEKTAKQLPPISENIEIISGNLIDITDDLADSLPQILEDVEVVTGTLGDTSESLSSAFLGGRRQQAPENSTLQQILTIASGLLGLVSKGKDEEPGKKKKKKK